MNYLQIKFSRYIWAYCIYCANMSENMLYMMINSWTTKIQFACKCEATLLQLVTQTYSFYPLEIKYTKKYPIFHDQKLYLLW